MKYQNIVITISSYTTNDLRKTLKEYGELGFKLVNVIMAKNHYNEDTMYVFFVKEMED